MKVFVLVAVYLIQPMMQRKHTTNIAIYTIYLILEILFKGVIIKQIEYFCGPDFDPRCGQELSVPEWLLKKIRYAKLTKLAVDSTFPLDGIRSNRIAGAIDDWNTQYREIFGKHKEIE